MSSFFWNGYWIDGKLPTFQSRISHMRNGRSEAILAYNVSQFLFQQSRSHLTCCSRLLSNSIAFLPISRPWFLKFCWFWTSFELSTLQHYVSSARPGRASFWFGRPDSHFSDMCPLICWNLIQVIHRLDWLCFAPIREHALPCSSPWPWFHQLWNCDVMIEMASASNVTGHMHFECTNQGLQVDSHE